MEGSLEETRISNIIDMGLGFSAMLRLFKKGSKLTLHKRILDVEGRAIFKAESKADFDRIHAEFCDWGTTNIILARTGRLASYGQIAKTFNVTLKVAVYYSHLPDREKARQLSEWLHAAVDTRMMAELAKKYPRDILPAWPVSVEEVDRPKYQEIQNVVRKFIKEQHLTPVQFDEKYWKEWNP